jgi:hypothetical protein
MIRPLADILKETERHTSDAEWNGDTNLARKLETVAHRLRERIAAGEEWEPSF